MEDTNPTKKIKSDDESENGVNFLSHLPSDLKNYLISHFDMDDLVVIAQVSKELKKLCYSHPTWKNITTTNLTKFITSIDNERASMVTDIIINDSNALDEDIYKMVGKCCSLQRIKFSIANKVITDSCLQAFVELKDLSYLDLIQCISLSEEAVQNLQAILPNAYIPADDDYEYESDPDSEFSSDDDDSDNDYY